ncbi:MAG TPA: sigma-54-dependent Fis family transcriptional regulator, partial [Chitinophagaceae bacterium]|nr:sigma-54-dependent Fis family transcriptional regulator [Chitinophagaceae bacterium]
SGPAGADFANEREILYKLFFDMKKDVNELKKMFFDILQNPSLAQHAPVYHADGNDMPAVSDYAPAPSIPGTLPATGAPVIIRNESGIQQHEDIDESLSIIDKEKELIVKALKKHRGKRKDAALDLGISERTLYRKLKEYDIENL